MSKKNYLGKIIVLLLILVIFAGAYIFFSLEKKSLPDGDGDLFGTMGVGESQTDYFEIQPVAGSVKDLAPISAEDHFWGDLLAPVQIIIFEDFDCEFCANLEKELVKVRENFPDDVVIAYRHSPLSTRLLAYWAALASECAAEQGKFWEMYDKLFFDHQFGTMNSEQYKQDAKDLGLNSYQFNKCLDEEKYRARVEEQAATAEASGAYGSPTIFINREVLPGAYPFEDFNNQQGEPQEGLESVIKRKLNEANQ